MGHHPISWFLHTSQEPLKSLLFNNRALYLHGHAHEVMVNTTTRGLLSLGFGAVYQAPLDAPDPSYYENCFAICHAGSRCAPCVGKSASLGTPSTVDGQLNARLPVEFSEVSGVLAGGHRFALPGAATKTPAAENECGQWKSATGACNRESDLAWVAHIRHLGEAAKESLHHSGRRRPTAFN